MSTDEQTPVIVGFSHIDSVIPSQEAAVVDIEQSDLELSEIEMARFLATLGRAKSQLEEAENASEPGILTTAHDPFASILQSHLAEVAETTGKTDALASGGAEAKFDRTDILGWAQVVWVKLRSSKLPIPRPGPDVTDIPDQARIAVVGDWGTGLYGAPRIADAIARDGDYDVLLHLGDVYYSGTRKEVRQRFLNGWPSASGRLNRALNSNHEMYSGGAGYFQDTLPAFGQSSSYFALQNSSWLLVGLDTAYDDHAIDDTQAAWLERVITGAGNRKVLLFSHHQLYSHLGSQGPKLANPLANLLGRQRIDGWYWGHEHLQVVYDQHPSSGLHARCVGHGGMPDGRKKLRHLPVADHQSDEAIWRRVDSDDAPAALVLDGSNRYIVGEEDKFAPHGYMTVELDGDALVERVHDADGGELLRLAR